MPVTGEETVKKHDPRHLWQASCSLHLGVLNQPRICRGQEVQLQSASASARLNVNAAAFVPSSGSQTSTVGDESAPTTWQSPLQLQFGSLPQSLSVSPQLCADGQQEHPGFEQGEEHGNGEGGTYPEVGLGEEPSLTALS